MIHIKTPSEMEWMREAGRINALAHQAVQKHLEPGISTRELNEVAKQVLIKYGGTPTFQQEYGFPGNICVSVNEEVGHGVPGPRIIQSGDVVKIDIGVGFHGYHSDCAITRIIGNSTPAKQHLVDVCQQALYQGIRCAVPGRRISDISHAIHQVVKANGLSVVRNAYGHGIGRRLHEEPRIVNFGPHGRGPRIRAGMVLAIEPLVTNGSRYTRNLEDGWTSVTIDGSIGSHFEHTVLVADQRPDILTLLPDQQFFVFRTKIEADHPRLLELARQQMNPVLKEAWGRPVEPEEILDIPDSETIVIENRSGEIAGFYTFKINDARIHLSTIVIDSPYQGQGLGKQAIAELEKIAATQKCAAVELYVQTNNQKAIRFYEKLGFRPIGMTWFRTIAMRKPISAGLTYLQH